MRLFVALTLLLALPAIAAPDANPSAAANSLGLKSFAEEDFAAALVHFQDAVRLAPEQAEYHNNAGMCLLHLDNPALAMQYFRSAISLRTDFALYHYNLGLAAQTAGQAAAAIEAYRAALARNTAFFDAAARLGVILYQQNRKQEAVDVWKKALSIKPDADVFSFLGAALLELDADQEALGALQKSIALNPQNHIPHYNLGNLYRKLKRPIAAEDSFARAYQLNQSFYPALYNLALVQIELQQNSAARTSLSLYLRTLPPHLTEQRKDAEQKLESLENAP